MTLDDNQLVALNLMALKNLESFSINNNPEFNTAVFPDNSKLTNISMNDCDVVHFYEKSMPKLSYLSIENGSLDEIVIDDYYPSLSKLDLIGNRAISSVDVTGCPELTDLELSYTGISTLNTSKNPKLSTLKAQHTSLETLALTYNKSLSNLYVSNTKLKKLDVKNLSVLRNIVVDSTDIASLDLTKKLYLSNVSARNTKIQFLDMHDQIGYNSLKELDIRDNKNMTAQTLNYTFAAMPYHNGDSYRTNVFIKGIPGAEKSNTDLITDDFTNYYKTDVNGNNTASMDSVTLTLGSVEGGSIRLSQVGKNGGDDTWHAIQTKAMPGYPISVVAQPADGYIYKGIEVDGVVYDDTIFVVSSAAKVAPVFKKQDDQVITLTVPVGAMQQYFIAGQQPTTLVTVDWGDGNVKPYLVGLTPSAITNETGTLGSKVTITGAVTYADFSSYPGFGTDNKISKIDISKNTILKSLSTYMNSIGSLDVSHEADLEFLDCSYSELESLDVTKNPKLKTLKAYGNELEELDVTTSPDLEVLDVKSNWLEELNTLGNTKLQKLDVQGNDLTELNVSSMYNLTELNVSGNALKSLDVAKNNKLVTLSASRNKLTELNVENNPLLQSLLVDGNQLSGLDLHNQKTLTLLYVSNNGWDACTLNDLYYSLNKYPELQQSGYATGNTLWVSQNGDQTPNDALHAESDIAKGKGWAVNVDGDGTACDQAYVTIMDAENGDVKVLTTENAEVKSGSKVKKNSVLTLQATPDDGYMVSSAKVNGAAIADNQFTVTKATDIYVKFVAVADGIEGVNGAKVTVEAGQNELVVTADAPSVVTIFSLNGKQIYSTQVSGQEAIGLNAGIYVVKIGNTSRKVLVK